MDKTPQSLEAGEKHWNRARRRFRFSNLLKEQTPTQDLWDGARIFKEAIGTNETEVSNAMSTRFLTECEVYGRVSTRFDNDFANNELYPPMNG